MSGSRAEFSDRAMRLRPSAIRAMAAQAGLPGVVSFAAGAPNAAQFPYDPIAEAMARLTRDRARFAQALQYGASEGYLPLREFLASHLSRLGGAVEVDEILITSGAQQALEFIGKLFVNAGDRIVTVSPTYIGALQAFGLFEPEVVGVPLRDTRLDLERLEREFAKAPRFFYVMPDCGNPTGTSLPLEDRQALLDLARRYRVPVIEDQAYDQLHLSGHPMPTLLELDRAAAPEDRVVTYLGTFSKSLTPGLRVGWIVAPGAQIDRLVSIKQASDLNSGMLNQVIVDEVAREALLSHGEVLRGFYRRQRDAMLAALEAHMPPGVHWTRPAGGMFVWLTLPEGADAAALLPRIFEREKVIYVPGQSFHPDGSGRETMRLSYSIPTPEKIEAGIAGLARAVQDFTQTA
jgi:DNA-binding transcriptional MocR family regulator